MLRLAFDFDMPNVWKDPMWSSEFDLLYYTIWTSIDLKFSPITYVIFMVYIIVAQAYIFFRVLPLVLIQKGCLSESLEKTFS